MSFRIPYRTWADRWRLVGVVGGIAAITALHLLTPLPHGHDMALHARHTVLEGLYYLPIFLAAYSWGLWGGVLAGGTVDVIYAVHTQVQLGGVLDPVNRSRLLALIIFPIVGLALGWLTDRLRRETRALLDAERALRRAEMLAALGELSAGLAHEIRNPLAAIRGAAEVLAGGVPPGSKDEEFARLLVSETTRLDRVVTDVLAFARPGRGGEEVSDPSSTVAATLTLLRGQASRAKVEAQVVAQGAIPPVRCPPEALKQILLNLGLNALQAMNGSGGRLIVGLSRERDMVLITVDDTGPGVPPAERERVFHPFVTTKPGGTGLGLSIAARLATECGGRIHAGEAPGGGARFLVHLPVASADAEAPVPEVIG